MAVTVSFAVLVAVSQREDPFPFLHLVGKREPIHLVAKGPCGVHVWIIETFPLIAPSDGQRMLEVSHPDLMVQMGACGDVVPCGFGPLRDVRELVVSLVRMFRRKHLCLYGEMRTIGNPVISIQTQRKVRVRKSLFERVFTEVEVRRFPGDGIVPGRNPEAKPRTLAADLGLQVVFVVVELVHLLVVMRSLAVVRPASHADTGQPVSSPEAQIGICLVAVFGAIPAVDCELYGLLRELSDNIDHAAHRIRSIERGLGALQDFDAFDVLQAVTI